jgi:hypothetical protein
MHKLHVKGESPTFVQYSARNLEKCKNPKSLKFNQNIKTFKKYFKIFVYEDVREILTPNILIPTYKSSE